MLETHKQWLGQLGLNFAIATPQQPGTRSAHRGAPEDASCRGRLLAWRAIAQSTVETLEKDRPIVPLVDLVVVIDSSALMKDEAVSLNAGDRLCPRPLPLRPARGLPGERIKLLFEDGKIGYLGVSGHQYGAGHDRTHAQISVFHPKSE